jgi:hypothetical protein
VLRRVEARQVGEHEARGVADAPVAVAGALEDLVGHRDFVAVIRGRQPQAQHVRAEVVHGLARRNDIAEGLGHLAPLAIDGEAVREHGPKGASP